MEDRIESLEAEVAKLKKKPKDGWDKTQILFAALVPFSVAFIGWAVTDATRQAQDEFTRERMKFEKSKAEIDDQYRRYQDARESDLNEKKEARESESTRVAMIQKLADDLGSANKATSAAARLRLQKLDPDTYAVVDAALTQKDAIGPASQEKAEVKARQAIISDFFDQERGKRISAFSTIRKFHLGDSAMLKAILEEFKKHQDDPDRTYSTAAVVNWFSTRPLRDNRAAVEAFIARIPVSAEWAKTNEINAKVTDRLKKDA